ncbi:MAG: transketolase, partial [Spirochaetaceae bacterium]|nr:transketolase [Spirochaetaceae bacterium]
YQAYGWQVLQGSMYDYQQISDLVEQAKKDDRPSLIMLKSEIGKGAPTVVGKSAAHGAPLGEEGVKAAKEFLGLPVDKDFYVVPEAYEYFASKKDEIAKKYDAWQEEFKAWASEEKELKSLWDSMMSGNPVDVEEKFPTYTTEDKLATRAASGAMLQVLEKMYPGLVGGSADLEGPNSCKLKSSSYFSANDRAGRNIHFGIREFAMAAITNGLYLHGGLKPFCATFLVFADYMKPAIRLGSLMKLPVLYIFTHDSIYVGEDGPTHQPIETVTSLRTIPGVQVLRPGDAQETELAWLMASESKDHPVCIMLTRQNLPVYEKADSDWKKTIRCGAYVAYNCEGEADVTVLATGSEVSLAIDAANIAKSKGKNVRVLSVIDRELFANQPEQLQATLIGQTKRVVTLEAGIKTGWEQFVKSKDDIISIDTFGTSAPFAKVAEYFGFTPEKVAEKLCK